ncbi:MAG: glycogen/starch/alpha-glucan phosphorylase, partial [Nitrospiraceae bacterium]|nr:glycogen/starch/alpha-glucan phosphorylase [Nitrospiraceae bacterium]
FRKDFAAVKRANKECLARFLRDRLGIESSPDSLFDVQIKRIHEYKRQLLNVLHIVTAYSRIIRDPAQPVVPRTAIFAGKAAPGYATAKLIIQLINDVAEIVNHDHRVAGRLNVAFIPNYSVSNAEMIIPAADLSEQISTAGTEASGTGNMKLAMNGALTIGTLDGANIEIRTEVGEENIFIFGLTADEVLDYKRKGYVPRSFYAANEELRTTLDMIGSGYFSPDEPGRFRGLVDGLLKSDPFFLLADYAAYLDAQKKVEEVFVDPERWIQMAILNVARMSRFSSDRTIGEYAREIWGVSPLIPPSRG